MFSTKGRYALRVMVDLAQQDSDEFIPLKDVAARQDISKKYLESIIALLVKENYLEGLRGKGGGYKLVKKPEEYTVRSILLLTEGTLSPVYCLAAGEKECSRASECKTLPLWEGLDKLINDYLENITIAQLAANPFIQNDYSI